MIVNLLLVLLVLIFTYIYILEYTGYIPDNNRKHPMLNDQNGYNNDNHNDGFRSERFSNARLLEYNQEPTFPPVTYKTDYKPYINQENDYLFVPYQEYIKKDILPENNFSLSQELTHLEMDQFLKIIQKKINNKIQDSNVKSYMRNINRDKWDEKIILKDKTYEYKTSLEEYKKSHNFSKYSNLISIAELLTFNFVNILNKEFTKTEYYDKYQKYHIFENYVVENIHLLRHFEYNKEGDIINRLVFVIYIHRKDKTHDFNILLDYFMYSKSEIKKSLESVKDIINFNRDNFIFLKECMVYGMPIRHNYKYLDYDDILDNLKIEKLIDFETKEKIIDLTQRTNLMKKDQIDIKLSIYIEFIDLTKNIYLNQNLNKNNFFSLLLIFNNLEKYKDTKPIHKEYNRIVSNIIRKGLQIINNKDYEKKDFKNLKEYDLDYYNSNVLNNEEENKKMIQKKINDIKLDSVSINFKCFHPLIKDKTLNAKLDNRMFCESYHKDINNSGVWDRKCEKDTECPYFNSNKNYPNNFGGCIEGKCQMPKGIERIGMRKISTFSRPLCHNCDETPYNEDCCFKQSLNKKLKSPDYIFENDIHTRRRFADNLKKIGLNV